MAGAGAPEEGGRMVSPVISSRIKSIACVEVAGRAGWAGEAAGLRWQPVGLNRPARRPRVRCSACHPG